MNRIHMTAFVRGSVRNVGTALDEGMATTAFFRAGVAFPMQSAGNALQIALVPWSARTESHP
jgi:hypothetical protein